MSAWHVQSIQSILIEWIHFKTDAEAISQEIFYNMIHLLLTLRAQDLWVNIKINVYWPMKSSPLSLVT